MAPPPGSVTVPSKSPVNVCALTQQGKTARQAKMASNQPNLFVSTFIFFSFSILLIRLLRRRWCYVPSCCRCGCTFDDGYYLARSDIPKSLNVAGWPFNPYFIGFPLI